MDLKNILGYSLYYIDTIIDYSNFKRTFDLKRVAQVTDAIALHNSIYKGFKESEKIPLSTAYRQR